MRARGEAAYAVLSHVRPLHLLAARAVTRRLEGQRITMAIRALLERLEERGPQTVPQVAEWLDVSRQAVQRVVDDAVRLGYVELRDNPAHRRSWLVALTGEGRRTFGALHAEELRTLGALTAGIEPDDLRTCADVLERMTAALAEQARDAR